MQNAQTLKQSICKTHGLYAKYMQNAWTLRKGYVKRTDFELKCVQNALTLVFSKCMQNAHT